MSLWYCLLSAAPLCWKACVYCKWTSQHLYLCHFLAHNQRRAVNIRVHMLHWNPTGKDWSALWLACEPAITQGKIRSYRDPAKQAGGPLRKWRPGLVPVLLNGKRFLQPPGAPAKAASTHALYGPQVTVFSTHCSCWGITPSLQVEMVGKAGGCIGFDSQALNPFSKQKVGLHFPSLGICFILGLLWKLLSNGISFFILYKVKYSRQNIVVI